jgi:hypothetical protein
MAVSGQTMRMARASSNRRVGCLGMVGMALAGIAVLLAGYLGLAWPWMRAWGATTQEVNAPMPGDELVPPPSMQTTHAVTIRATPEQIYPWIKQIGVERGGMYSYDALENLFGLKVHTIKQIVPALQTLKPGDFMPFTPHDFMVKPGPGVWVVSMEENRTLLGCMGMANEQPQVCPSTWQFLLVPQGDGTTRLILRSTNPAGGSMLADAGSKLWGGIPFIMERKMLLTLKECAEQS